MYDIIIMNLDFDDLTVAAFTPPNYSSNVMYYMYNKVLFQFC